ncbi:MAG: hypothetical protein DRJ30_03840 [Candidatus Methanomethylicota archaeon]|nr:MAG: hypothetical protein DRJ30_03840 [Candidatus Verstraetearchaeota archaeon]
MELKYILERGRCSWGKCYFCGWGKRQVDIDIEELERRLFNFLLKNRRKATINRLKLFSSGSLLDEKQFPDDFIEWLVGLCEKLEIEELIVESRPEYVNERRLKLLKSKNLRVTVAMGLELADDEILLKYYNKGVRVKDYVRAIETLRREGFGVRLYVLLNGHPILYSNPRWHRKIFEKTMNLAYSLADSIVIINAYPHVNSELWEAWIRGEWKPLDKRQFLNMVGRWLENEKVELDFKNYNFLPKFPSNKRIFLRGVGLKYLVHPYYEVWQDYIVRFYEPPVEKIYALFLPCAYRKPYTRSKTWKAILNKISGYSFFKKLHLIAVSSPGVIPYEFIRQYPFTSYDWQEWLETDKIKEEYIKVTSKRVRNYIEHHDEHYKHYFAYFRPNAETLKAIRNAFKEMGLTEKLTAILDEKTYGIIEREGFKPAVAHPKALNRLLNILKAEFEKTDTRKFD